MRAPDTIPSSPEILRLIGRIDEFKGAWRALGRLAPDRLSALRRVATIESIGSSTRIEGASLSDRDVARLLSELEISVLSSRDEQEVAGYAEAMEVVFESYREIPVTENHIKQLHGILLKHSSKDEWHRGHYKTSPNHVVARGERGDEVGVVFQTASPVETPVWMDRLVRWYSDEPADHPLLVAAVFIVLLLAVHPFQDGNGRLSRVLTSMLLLKAGYEFVPYSSLESVVEQNRREYYLALQQTQTGLRSDAPDWNPWLLFFLRSVDQQISRLEAKLEHEQRVIAGLPELSVEILEIARNHGRVTMKDAIEATGVSRNTLKGHFRRLADEGHLRLRGAGRGAWYELG